MKRGAPKRKAKARRRQPRPRYRVPRAEDEVENALRTVGMLRVAGANQRHNRVLAVEVVAQATGREMQHLHEAEGVVGHAWDFIEGPLAVAYCARERVLWVCVL